jgi:amino acid transporter
MADADRSLAVATGQDELAHGSLGFWDAVAISVSVIAPGMAMLHNVPGVAIAGGGSTPPAFLLGGIGCLALAFVVCRLLGTELAIRTARQLEYDWRDVP